MSTIFPNPGVPPPVSAPTSPAPTQAELRGTGQEQPPSAGGGPANHPSGIPALTWLAHYGQHEDPCRIGIDEVLNELSA